MIEWRAVPSFPWLEASSDGRVRRCVPTLQGHADGGELTGGLHEQTGYLIISVCRYPVEKTVAKHTLICEAFHGPKPTPEYEVAHWDAVKTNNAADNLRWVTRAENEADKRRHGRDNAGERHGMSLLTSNDVLEIRRLRANGLAGQQVAALFNISRSTVYAISARRRWRHLSEKAP